MRVLVIFLTVNFFLFCSANSMYECIGLGETCTVAAALQMFELRNAAYPFDWTISHYKGLCAVLKKDFRDFLDPSYLSVRDDNHGIINKYGLVFVHDFPTVTYSGNLETEDTVGENELRSDWIQFLPEVQKKYDRRIQRLRDVCKSKKKVYFIRHGGINSRRQACALRDIIKTTYPRLDFTLVIIGNWTSFAEPWGEKHIKNYYLPNVSVWNDVTGWKDIFVDLGLVS